jgi:MSHA biogenesis protein MshK
MDEAVTTKMISARAVAAAALCGAVCLAAGAACAQALQDPTRPPAAATPVAAGPAAAVGPQLQSILVARQRGGRHVAVIDGETVRPGDTFHGAKVARIGENEVELVRGGERQVLRLYAQADAGMMPARTARR